MLKHSNVRQAPGPESGTGEGLLRRQTRPQPHWGKTWRSSLPVRNWFFFAV